MEGPIRNADGRLISLGEGPRMGRASVILTTKDTCRELEGVRVAAAAEGSASSLAKRPSSGPTGHGWLGLGNERRELARSSKEIRDQLELEVSDQRPQGVRRSPRPAKARREPEMSARG